MRNIAFLLETFIRDESVSTSFPSQTTRTGFLFENITDKEMDQLFGFTGN